MCVEEEQSLCYTLGRLMSSYKTERDALLFSPTLHTFFMCSEFLPEPCPCAGVGQRAEISTGWAGNVARGRRFGSLSSAHDGKSCLKGRGKGTKASFPVGEIGSPALSSFMPAFTPFSMKA